MDDLRPNITLPTPGTPVIAMLNWVGLRTLYVKEVRRFFKVHLQTIWAPAMTTLLFLVIFTVAMGRGGAVVHVGGEEVPFADFVAPGLIIMGMIQNAFANSSFSLLAGKMQGTIVDYLMPPLSSLEVLTGLMGAAVTRAFFVGCAVWLAMCLWPGVHVMPHALWAVFYFGLMGSMLLAFMGVLTSLWAEKFDHAAAVTNFIVQPLSLLSGTFYSADHLAPWYRTISHANPIFYVISGFRYGFLGVSDLPITAGGIGLLLLNAALGLLCYCLLKTGWRIKA
ncbi:MAG: ABC transporter permease [Sphingomonadaceae bacterium]|nr:ABC transporter permease [Sphingomonadaceae bacterium]